MPETIQITKDQLNAAFLAWENNYRAGNTRTFEETRALPAEQVAKESTESMWATLTESLAVVQ